MGIREKVNDNPRVVVLIVALLTLVAAGAAVVHVWSSRHRIVSELPDAFFSTDDGKTFFKANQKNVAPFEYEGKIAVRAMVFDCAGKKFVGFLERYTDIGRKAMLEKRSNSGTQLYQREVKKPGDATWVNVSDEAKSRVIVDVKCPDGSGHDPDPVEP